ncbi:MAG: hypothetical protein JJT76_00580 [Clostridiaceae bacterium]|nr:hypothetical protein [Clostridiaceae bacterium]
MDKIINIFIEKTLKKPATPFLREACKGIIILFIGFFLILAFVKSTDTRFDITGILLAIYPLGLYYGFKPTFNIAKKLLSLKPKMNSNTGDFNSDSINGAVSATLSVILFFIALILGWFIGIFNYIKILIEVGKEPIPEAVAEIEEKFTIE